jgi:hypothetical protein
MCVPNPINFTDYVTSFAAVAGVVFAGIGLSAWRKQLHGTSEYELARRLMLQVYQLRDALQATRNPFVSVAEGNKEDTEETWEISAYEKRWKLVQEVIAQFKVTSLEAEVVWGDMTKPMNKGLLKLVGDLNFAMYMFVKQRRDKAFADDFNEKFSDTLYWIDDKDKYSKALNAVVKDYEEFLTPHLRR